MCKSTRRGFLAGCSAAIAALSGSRFTSMAFGQEGSDNDEILITVFLRGGMDGLSFVMPIAGADRGFYEAARPDIQVPTSGANAALPLNAQFGLHPRAAPIHDLYQNGNISFIHASGMDEPNRSHFDAMQFIELGTPGTIATPTGWLTRHWQSATNVPTEIIMPSLAAGNLQHASLRGHTETINMDDVGQFALNTGPSSWRTPQRKALRRLLDNDNTWLHQSSTQALDALDVIELSVDGSYTPAGGAVYPGGSWGDNLELIAQMVKLDLGLRTATVDLGGWDTHNGQGDDGGGYFGGLIEDLAEGLKALYVDLEADSYHQRLTVVVISEFGRRFVQNADRGSDHGHGNVMTVMSGNAVGGVRGPWPGLGPGQLYDNADLAVATDYRQVLSEILIRRMGNNRLGTIFPGYTNYAPLGVVSGPDLPPIYGNNIFSDGFEAGNTGAWSRAVG